MRQLSEEEHKESGSSNENVNDLPIEQTDEWRTKPKHIFILSEAGKPIYSLLVALLCVYVDVENYFNSHLTKIYVHMFRLLILAYDLI